MISSYGSMILNLVWCIVLPLSINTRHFLFDNFSEPQHISLFPLFLFFCLPPNLIRVAFTAVCQSWWLSVEASEKTWVTPISRLHLSTSQLHLTTIFNPQSWGCIPTWTSWWVSWGKCATGTMSYSYMPSDQVVLFCLLLLWALLAPACIQTLGAVEQ